jgi:hypothetical protein
MIRAKTRNDFNKGLLRVDHRRMDVSAKTQNARFSAKRESRNDDFGHHHRSVPASYHVVHPAGAMLMAERRANEAPGNVTDDVMRAHSNQPARPGRLTRARQSAGDGDESMLMTPKQPLGVCACWLGGKQESMYLIQTSLGG